MAATDASPSPARPPPTASWPKTNFPPIYNPPSTPNPEIDATSLQQRGGLAGNLIRGCHWQSRTLPTRARKHTRPENEPLCCPSNDSNLNSDCNHWSRCISCLCSTMYCRARILACCCQHTFVIQIQPALCNADIPIIGIVLPVTHRKSRGRLPTPGFSDSDPEAAAPDRLRSSRKRRTRRPHYSLAPPRRSA